MARKTFTFEGKRYDITAKTEKELNKKIKEKIKELKRKSSYIYGFSEWYEVYLETYKCDVAPRTYSSYLQRFNKHLKPYFKNKKLPNITPLDCQQFLNKLKGYSGNTIHKLFYDLKSCFDMAIVNGYIYENPMKRCIMPSGGSTSRRALTPREREVTLKVASYHPSGLYILFMLFCGLRPHEAAYIQGKDIEGDVLHIRGTKSVCADRWVPIPDYLLKRLPEVGKEEYYITSIRGIAPVKECHRNKSWNSFKKEMEKYMEINDDLTPYCFRHSYCTDLQDAGVPINIARDFMGHSTITLTSKIYTHRSDKSFNGAKALINSHINSQ